MRVNAYDSSYLCVTLTGQPYAKKTPFDATLCSIIISHMHGIDTECNSSLFLSHPLVVLMASSRVNRFAIAALGGLKLEGLVGLPGTVAVRVDQIWHDVEFGEHSEVAAIVLG